MQAKMGILTKGEKNLSYQRNTWDWIDSATYSVTWGKSLKLPATHHPWHGYGNITHPELLKDLIICIRMYMLLLLLLLLSRFSCVWLCATPQRAAHQAPPSLGFSRQEHWSGLPFPSPHMHIHIHKRLRTMPEPATITLLWNHSLSFQTQCSQTSSNSRVPSTLGGPHEIWINEAKNFVVQ